MARDRSITPEQRAQRTEYMRGWRERNRERHNQLARQSYERNKDKPENKASRDRYHLWRRYGITPEEYEGVLWRQGGVCAICKKPPGKKRLHIDHSHETGSIRGLLCTGCNTRLGWFERYGDAVAAYL